MSYAGKNFQTGGSEPAAFETKSSGRLAQVTKLDVGDTTQELPVTGTALPNSKAGIDIGSLPVWQTANLQDTLTGTTDTVILLDSGTNATTAVAGDILLFPDNGTNQQAHGVVASVVGDTVTLVSALPYVPYPASCYTFKPAFLTAPPSESGAGYSLGVALTTPLPGGSNTIGRVAQAEDWTVDIGNLVTVRDEWSTPAFQTTFTAATVGTTSVELAPEGNYRAGLTIRNTHQTKPLLVAYGFVATASDYSQLVPPGCTLEVEQRYCNLAIHAVVTSGTLTANVSVMDS